VRRKLCAAIALSFAFAGIGTGVAQASTTLKVYGTSDVTDSNLLDGYIRSNFHDVDPNVTINYVAQGTGAALNSATVTANGADVVMVHSPSLEATFVAGGHSTEPDCNTGTSVGRAPSCPSGQKPYGRSMFYNDYVIIGPTGDPAGVLSGAPHDAVGAYQLIAARGGGGSHDATFVSRDDNSGTNVQEQTIWGLTTGVSLQAAHNGGGSAARKTPVGAGGPPSFPAWYVPNGDLQGQNVIDTNTCSSGTYPQGGCYTMTDRGTWLYQKSLGHTSNLKIVSDVNSAGAVGGASLQINPFHAYIVSTAPHPTEAAEFMDYLTGDNFQTSINDFNYGSGSRVFFPDAYEGITNASIPTHASADSGITISGQLIYKVPSASSQGVASLPVTLQESPDGSSWSTATSTTTTNTDSSGNVTFHPTIGTADTFYRFHMDDFYDAGHATKFTANDDPDIGTNGGLVEITGGAGGGLDCDPLGAVPAACADLPDAPEIEDDDASDDGVALTREDGDSRDASGQTAIGLFNTYTINVPPLFTPAGAPLPTYGTVRETPNALVIGNAENGWTINVTESRPGVASCCGQPDSDWAFGGVLDDTLGYSAPCGWIMYSHADPGDTPTLAACPDPPPGGRHYPFMSYYNCATPAVPSCSRGTPVYVQSDTPECANVGLNPVTGASVPPLSHVGGDACPAGSQDSQVGALRAGRCVEWRYITTDGRWVMVRDPLRHHQRASWLFIERGALSPDLVALGRIGHSANPEPPGNACPQIDATGRGYKDGTQ
jgi:tungstate transport system substrate-binding protein